MPQIVAFIVSFVLVQLALRSAFAYSALDHPNARSLHDTPVPRVGSIGVIGGTFAGWIAYGQLHWSLTVGCLVLAVVSLFDDSRQLKPGIRLLVHFVVAASFLAGIGYSLGVPLFVFLVIVVAWAMNLYNFMDGSDGLAGGMTVFGFAFYGAAAIVSGDPELAALSLCISAAALAFLFFNFFPARVFLGDAGSIPLGFLAAGIGLTGWLRGAWPFWFPLLVFSPFVVDASVTLARRLQRRERVWEAHRGHYYQRLVRSGLGHRGTAFAEYVLMMLCGSSALAMLDFHRRLQIVLLLAWCVVYIILIVVVEKRWNRMAKGGNR